MSNEISAAAKWYAVYVRSRYEKKTAKLFNDFGIEMYLPMVTKIKQWSDRRKKVEEPLFRSYIFVHTNLRNYFDILNIPGVVRFVSFEGKPVDIPDNQIAAIHEYVGQVAVDEDTLRLVELQIGQKVMVKYGGMKGLQGNLVKFKDKHWIVVDFEMFDKKLAVEVERTIVEPVSL